MVPIACITESIPNTGKFVWTPSTSLEPDVTHYGLQIIVDGTGEYQYSTQFGISNPSYNPATTHSTTTSQHTNTATKEHTETATGTAPQTTPTTVSSQSSSSQIHSINATIHSTTTPVIIISTLSTNATHLTGPTAPHPTIASTGIPHHNSTHLRGTKTLTVPKTLQSPSAKRTTKTSHVVASATNPASSPLSTSAATSSPAAATANGAAQLGAAGGLIAALAAAVSLVL